MLEVRTALPVAQSHDEILSAIQNNPVTIIRGETGSGKTTQVTATLTLPCVSKCGKFEQIVDKRVTARKSTIYISRNETQNQNGGAQTSRSITSRTD